MDQLSEETRQRWNALAEARVMHSLPFYDYTPEKAKSYAYRHGIIPDVAGKRVLCLASGGGQDSAAFGLLGAEVTVLDLSDVMLQRDSAVAAHHGYSATLIQGDMRDLSVLGDNAFDLVWQSISLNYCPSVYPVFAGVQRVLHPGGIYRLAIQNPFGYAMSSTWTGEGYLLKGPYIDGEDVTYYQPTWKIEQPDGGEVELPTPRLYRHALSTVLNSLASQGFSLLHLEEWTREGRDPEPGSWVHFTQCSPLFLDIYSKLMP